MNWLVGLIYNLVLQYYFSCNSIDLVVWNRKQFRIRKIFNFTKNYKGSNTIYIICNKNCQCHWRRWTQYCVALRERRSRFVSVAQFKIFFEHLLVVVKVKFDKRYKGVIAKITSRNTHGALNEMTVCLFSFWSSFTDFTQMLYFELFEMVWASFC